MKKYLTSFLIAFSAALRMANADQQAGSPTPALPGDPLPAGQVPVGYPYPATLQPSTGFEVYAKGNFLWYKPYAESTIIGTRTTTTGEQNRLLYMTNYYHPGFKLALGADLGPLLAEVQYTRFHYTASTHYSAGNGHVITPGVLASLVFSFGPPSGSGGTFAHVKGNMKFFYDNIKAIGIKPVYAGRKLIVDAQYGLMGGWETHALNIKATQNLTPGFSDGFANGFHKFWILGPTAGVHAKALLPWGFRALGNLDLSIFYLRFTKSKFAISFPNSSTVVGQPNPLFNLTSKYKEPIESFAPQVEGSLGLGWDSYLVSDKLHLDIAVTYDFMARNMAPPEAFYEAFLDDINLHGFNIQCRLDF